MSERYTIENENIMRFLEKVAEDKEMQAKFAIIRNPEEAYKLASSVQGGFTQEEFVAEMKKLFEEATKELSDDDIAKLAGGKVDDTDYEAWIASTIVGSITVGLPIAVAASVI